MAVDAKNSMTSNLLGGKYVVGPAHPLALLLGAQKIANPKTLSNEKALSSAGDTEVDGEVGYKMLSPFRTFIEQQFVVLEPQ